MLLQVCPAATALEKNDVFQAIQGVCIFLVEVILHIFYSQKALISHLQSSVLCCNTGPKPKVKEDDFEDLVSTQGFGSRSDKKGPRTIAAMRRQEMTKDVDPLKLQVTNLKFYITEIYTLH